MEYWNFTGKIAIGKDSEKFHPIMKTTYDSGWCRTRVMFNCLSGTNRVTCVVDGGKWAEDSKNGPIKTFSKTVTDANGNVTKGTKIDIPWSKRFDKDQIEMVAGFRKFVVDTGNIQMRYKLQDAINAFENGTITDEMIAQIGVNNIDDANAALTKSEAKKKDFLNEYDFAEYVAKLVQSDKYKDSMFNISGYYDVQYNANNGKFYTNYHVNRIVLAKENDEPKTEMKLDFYFGVDAFNDDDFEETGKAHISGYVKYYDSNVKENGFMPIVITVKEPEKMKNGLKRKFVAEDDEIKNIGLTVSIIEGAERKEITMEDLTDEQREDIEYGLLSFDEVKKSLGGNIVGDRISEIRFKELTAGKSSVQDTAYTTDDMNPAMKKEEDFSLPFDLDSDDDDL